MAAPLELRKKQRTVIEFLVAERETSVDIHGRLQNVYQENTLDYSNVRRWFCRLNDEKEETASIADKPRSGRPSSSVNPANKAKAYTLIRKDRRTTFDELAENFGVNHGSAYNIMPVTRESENCSDEWLKGESTEFYEAGIHALIRRWNIATERNGDYVEK